VIDDWVIDVTHFFTLHPGGADVLMEHIGKDASEVFRNADVHLHGKAALHLMNKFLIGYIDGKKTPEEVKRGSMCKKTAEDYGINLEKGLAWQVSALSQEKYEEFIHNVLVVNKPTLKYFDTPFLEMMTRSPWYTVPIVWIPIVIALFYFAISHGLQPWLVPVFIIYGPFAWNFFEYQIHKRIFHMRPKNQPTQLLHFLLHGYHHIYPTDPLRLTFPPIPCALITIIIYYGCGIYLLPLPYSIGAITGLIVGYIYYDLMHYYLHHSSPEFLFTKELKTHHLYHHYKNEESNFGISMSLFDYIFDTFDPTLMQEKKRRQEKTM